MTPPPSSAAASFCDAAAILPSLYLATARVLPRPAVASRLLDAPDAAPPRPAIAPAVAPDATPPRPAVAPAIVLPLPFRCYRAAVAPLGGCPAKPSRSAAIALYRALPSRRASPCRRARSRAARQAAFWCCPALLGRRPAHCHCPAVIPLSAQPSPAVIPLSPCCHLPGGHPAAIARLSSSCSAFPPCHQVPPRPAALPLWLCPAIVDLPCRVDSYSIVAGSSSRLLISTWPSLPPCRHLLRSLSLLSRWGCPSNPGSTLL